MLKKLWLAVLVMVALSLAAVVGSAEEVLISALSSENDVTLFVEGGASAGLGTDEDVKWHKNPALGIKGTWSMAWDALVLEFKPVKLEGTPRMVSLAIKGDPSFRSGKIQIKIKDSQGKTMQATIHQDLSDPNWHNIRTPLPGWGATWEGGDGKHHLTPPCEVESLTIYATKPAEATIFLADLKIELQPSAQFNSQE